MLPRSGPAQQKISRTKRSPIAPTSPHVVFVKCVSCTAIVLAQRAARWHSLLLTVRSPSFPGPSRPSSLVLSLRSQVVDHSRGADFNFDRTRTSSPGGTCCGQGLAWARQLGASDQMCPRPDHATRAGGRRRCVRRRPLGQALARRMGRHALPGCHPPRPCRGRQRWLRRVARRIGGVTDPPS